MSKRRVRAKPRAFRPARMLTPGLSGRLGTTDCSIGNLNHTGALLLTRTDIPLDTTWPLRLDLPSGAVEVTCRVVRCDSMEVQMPGAVWRRQESAIGVVFSAIAPEAMRAVRRFCRTSTPIEESAPRVLVVGSDSDLSKLISSTLADAEYVPRVVTELRDAPAVARRIGAKAAVIYLGGRRTIVDVVDALRGHAASRHIPIVACVVTSQLSDLQRAHLGEQRVRVLTLPLTPEELVDAVDRLLLDDGHA